MSQFVETPTKRFEADGAIAQYARAKMDADGKVTVCSASEAMDGTTEQEAFAAGDEVALRLRSAQGTRKMICSEAIAAGDLVYAAASGKVATTGTILEGKAVHATGADGDIVEVMSTEAASAAIHVSGVAAGYKVARGETALDGSNPTPVATGLTTVIAFVATLKGTAAPGVGTSVLTAEISGATANVYAWKVTGAGDTTLIASTGTESFYWVAVGT